MKCYTVSLRNPEETIGNFFAVNFFQGANELNGFEIDTKERFSSLAKDLRDSRVSVEELWLKETILCDNWCYEGNPADNYYVPYNEPRKAIVTCDADDPDCIKEGCVVRFCVTEKQLGQLSVLHQYMRSFAYYKSVYERDLYFFSGVSKVEIGELIDILSC